MSTMVVEVYRALRAAGVEEALAEAAARAVWQPEQPATKADIAQLESRLTWRMVAMTALFIAAVTALRIFTQ